jgi:hypothetical protein
MVLFDGCSCFLDIPLSEDVPALVRLSISPDLNKTLTKARTSLDKEASGKHEEKLDVMPLPNFR